MPNILQENGCIKAPGLAIGSGGKTTFSYGNTFRVKANGLISDDVTTADSPVLTTAPDKDAETPGDLAIDYERAYTLLAEVDSSDGTLTFTLVSSQDFAEGHIWNTQDLNWGNAVDDDSHKAVVGFIIIANTTNAFIPGTTALDAAGVSVRYFDNLLTIGA